ncbi:HNH endonuclease [Dawidia soli]|uniref:HNH endonuclease n=1 Tax=Dawidia soli TaxID=2782352 RepID=A0AAP2D6R6_9BACT|nr:HNH endonuclease [Dawidia soli]MBT1686433.1 HNH endonuclease [Dawidia soli]
MIQLTSKNISLSSLAHLSAVTQTIMQGASFEDQVQKAKSKWNNKGSGLGQGAFADIKKTLLEMCVGVEICAYCEQNEATDIEHIFPKRLYPEKAFSWENYIFACSKCNTHHKSDKFKIFDPKNSVIETDITPKRGTFTKPPTEDSLFINQRIEDPMDFFELDLVNQQFIFTEKHPPGTRNYLKAKFTKEVLGLNTRATLIESRKKAVMFYISRLEKFVKASATTTHEELSNSINDDWKSVDHAKDFVQEKTRILSSIKKDILEYSHPTVWKELIRQRANLPKTNNLLLQAPEALTW